MSLHYHYKQKEYELGRDKNVSLMRPFVNMHLSSLFNDNFAYFSRLSVTWLIQVQMLQFFSRVIFTKKIDKEWFIAACLMSSKYFWKHDLILGLSHISKLRTSYDYNLNIIQIYLFSSCVGGWSLREKHLNI